MNDPARAGLTTSQASREEDQASARLALKAAYGKYGKQVNEERLRVRLGSDRPANLPDDPSAAQLQPDLLRVLVQDRFIYKVLDPAAADTVEQLAVHQRTGGLVLLLIVENKSDSPHWVMSDAHHKGIMHVVDPLKPKATQEQAEDFIKSQALSIIAFRPASFDDHPTIDAAHADGLAEITRVRDRMRQRVNR